MLRFTHSLVLLFTALGLGCGEGQLMIGGQGNALPPKPDYVAPPPVAAPPGENEPNERAPAPNPGGGAPPPNPGGGAPPPEAAPPPEEVVPPEAGPGEGEQPAPEERPAPPPAPEEAPSPAPEPEEPAPPAPEGQPPEDRPAPPPARDREPAPDPQERSDPEPGFNDDGCTDEAHAGRCEGDVAVWCDGGVEARFDCRSKLNAGCGYVDLATGFFCRAEAQNPAPAPESPPVPDNPEGEAPVPEALEEPESNPEPSPEQSPEGGCGDLDYLGRCEGDMARWCDSSGQIQGVDCAGRGQSCGYVDEEVGYYCVDLPPVPEPEEVPPENGCGDVDYLGECAGDVARWCANGQISTLDCGSQGQVCGYVDDITGYYCREEAPQEQRPEAEPEAEPEVEPEPEPAPEFDGCDGVDFQGYCVGDVVHYCSSGQLVSMDCGVRDQTCGWVDDEVGNDCVEAN